MVYFFHRGGAENFYLLQSGDAELEQNTILRKFPQRARCFNLRVSPRKLKIVSSLRLRGESCIKTVLMPQSFKK
jgi:hypothetical protein